MGRDWSDASTLSPQLTALRKMTRVLPRLTEELALIYGGKRSATVVCNSTVELLAMSRSDFTNIFMSASLDQGAEHVEFLRAHPLMPVAVLKVIDGANEKILLFSYFRRDAVICADSNESDWIYFIKSGRCRIMKNVQLPSKRRKVQSSTRSSYQNRDSVLPPQKASNRSQTKQQLRTYFITLKVLERNAVF
ncbi:unnamed protein product, partial [Dicrocoelium dendriticum]